MPATWNWMSQLPDDRRLVDIIMPGSHDAGVYATNVTLNLGFKKSWAVCQSDCFYEQATWGSRFFDCRLFLQTPAAGERWKPAEHAIRAGHFTRLGEGAVNNGRGGIGGAYGGSLLEVIKDLCRFVMDRPTECVIVRFSHTACPDAVQWALLHVLAANHWTRFVYKGSGNIALTPLRDLRGKIVLAFDTEYHSGVSAAHQRKGFHPFYRYREQDDIGGLSCCGVYKGTDLMAAVVDNAHAGAALHAEHPRNHLHFVYYQQTMQLASVKKATQAPNKGSVPYTGGAHANLEHYLAEVRARAGLDDRAAPPPPPVAAAAPAAPTPRWLAAPRARTVPLPATARAAAVATTTTTPVKTAPARPTIAAGGLLGVPNVISHDFVNEQTCRQIIAMNPGFPAWS